MLKSLIAGLTGLLLCSAAGAQQRPREGVDYLTLNAPQAVEAAGKVEVTEFFWLRCPHCYTLEPVLQDWLKQLPRDAQFRRVPAIFNEEWALDARVYFALETTGDLPRVFRPLFDAVHQQGGTQQRGEGYLKWVAQWLSKNGVDMAKYDAALRSFTVETKLKRAEQMTRAYKIDGVPAMTVQGRWVVSASMSGERNVMIRVTDYLVGEARRQLAKK